MNASSRPASTDGATRPASAPALLDITLLAGGPGEEREVSLASGKSIAAALTILGHRVTVCDITPHNLSALEKPADRVFIALHGEFGEDGGLQRELERRGLIYTGTGPLGSALAMDKVKAKSRFIEAHVPTPSFDVARSPRLGQMPERWRLPVVIKPVRSGSSVDVHIVRERSHFAKLLSEVVQKHGEALVEEYIEGRELTVGILGNQALPVIEIRTAREFYDYQAKYVDEDTQYLFEIDLSPAVLTRVQESSVRAAAALGCRDFCRVDWMVDDLTHEPYVLEINTIPGFTSHSLLPKAAARAGLSMEQLCGRIVEMAVSRVPARV